MIKLKVKLSQNCIKGLVASLLNCIQSHQFKFCIVYVVKNAFSYNGSPSCNDLWSENAFTSKHQIATLSFQVPAIALICKTSEYNITPT